jgi:hypothetical protein
MPAADNHIYYAYIVDVLPAVILRHFTTVITAFGRKKNNLSD